MITTNYLVFNMRQTQLSTLDASSPVPKCNLRSYEGNFAVCQPMSSRIADFNFFSFTLLLFFKF